LKRILAIDTATWWGGVALLERDSTDADPVIVAEVGLKVEGSHAVHLLLLIEQLLAHAGWSKASLDGFVATRGPGFFTGIRIGLGTIRGLGLATDRPVAGVTTLRSMAQAFGPAEVDRVPLIPAGRGEVYGARYDAGSTPPVGLEQPWLGSPENGLADSRDAGPMVVFGPGLALARRCLSPSGGRLRPGPDPRSIAAGAGQISLLRGDFDNGDLPPLAPLYLRTPDVVLKHQGK
jgi:tRNA threonylcarbamoyladenosine biosynthesis protein TsaB